MSNSANEPAETPPAESGGTSDPDEPGYISDDQLPEDVRPSEDNPLAQDPDEEA